MVRCFEDDNVIHVNGKVDPISDIEVIQTELCLADLASVEKQIHRTSKLGRARATRKPSSSARSSNAAAHALDQAQPVRSLEFTKDEQSIVKPLFLITAKPAMFVGNVSDNGFENNPYLDRLREFAARQKAPGRGHLRQDRGRAGRHGRRGRRDVPGRDGPDRAGPEPPDPRRLHLLGLQTYFTAGVKEVRAWTVAVGATAPQAAGVIHTDFEKGFIRAQTIAYDDYVRLQGRAGRQGRRQDARGRQGVHRQGWRRAELPLQQLRRRRPDRVHPAPTARRSGGLFCRFRALRGTAPVAWRAAVAQHEADDDTGAALRGGGLARRLAGRDALHQRPRAARARRALVAAARAGIRLQHAAVDPDGLGLRQSRARHARRALATATLATMAIAATTAALMLYVDLDKRTRKRIWQVALPLLAVDPGAVPAGLDQPRHRGAVGGGLRHGWAVLFLRAMLREPGSGHGLVVIATLTFPVVMVALKLHLLPFEMVPVSEIVPLAAIGITVLTTGLVRANRRAQLEARRSTEALVARMRAEVRPARRQRVAGIARGAAHGQPAGDDRRPGELQPERVA